MCPHWMSGKEETPSSEFNISDHANDKLKLILTLNTYH